MFSNFSVILHKRSNHFIWKKLVGENWVIIKDAFLVLKVIAAAEHGFYLLVHYIEFPMKA